MKPVSSAGPKLLTTQQVSEYLRISLSTVHHLTRTGKLKPTKQGRQWLFIKEDIDGYLSSGYATAAALQHYEGKERRKSGRVRYLMQAYLLIQLPTRRWEGEGNILNISENGILFESRELLLYKSPMYNEALVTLILYPESGQRHVFEVKGKIIRSEIYNRTRFGIEFAEPLPEIAEILEAL